MRARPVQDKRQPRSARQQRRLRNSAWRAHGARYQVLHNQDGDVVGHQRDEHFVASEPRSDQGNHAGPHRSGSETQQEHQGPECNRGQRAHGSAWRRCQSQPTGGRGANHEASFKAQVTKTGSPADDGAQGNQRQRRGAHQGIAKSAHGCERFVEEREVRLERVRSIEDKEQRGDEHRRQPRRGPWQW